jgi:hypothetical protein
VYFYQVLNRKIEHETLIGGKHNENHRILPVDCNERSGVCCKNRMRGRRLCLMKKILALIGRIIFLVLAIIVVSIQDIVFL